MASEHEVRRLLLGVVTGDIYGAFGLSRKLTQSELLRACRRIKVSVHADRGNRNEISQIANACAEVLTDRRPQLSDCIQNVARGLMVEVMGPQTVMGNATAG